MKTDKESFAVEERFRGHPRFDGMTVENVKGDVEEFEADISRGYQEFAERTRKRTFLDDLRINPFSPTLIVAAFFDMTSGTCKAFNYKPSIPYLVLSTAAGIYMSSFMSGLLHLVLDNIPLQMVPTRRRSVVEFIAYGFQHHHAVQTNWSTQDVFAHGVLTVGLVGVLSAWLYFFIISRLGWISFEMGCGVLVYAFFNLNIQLIHAFAHNTYKKSHPRCHAVYLMLARTGLVLDNKHHHMHHTLFDRAFCTSNSWADPVVDWLFLELFRRGYVAPELHPNVQREVYLKKKKELKKPYFQMFPDWRFLDSLGANLTRQELQ